MTAYIKPDIKDVVEDEAGDRDEVRREEEVVQQVDRQEGSGQHRRPGVVTVIPTATAHTTVLIVVPPDQLITMRPLSQI